jgi:hypothetical protein
MVCKKGEAGWERTMTELQIRGCRGSDIHPTLCETPQDPLDVSYLIEDAVMERIDAILSRVDALAELEILSYVAWKAPRRG